MTNDAVRTMIQVSPCYHAEADALLAVLDFADRLDHYAVGEGHTNPTADRLRQIIEEALT